MQCKNGDPKCRSLRTSRPRQWFEVQGDRFGTTKGIYNEISKNNYDLVDIVVSLLLLFFSQFFWLY